MQLLGFVYLGPFGHFLHILLDKLFKGKKDSKTVAKKVCSLLSLVPYLMRSWKKGVETLELYDYSCNPK